MNILIFLKLCLLLKVVFAKESEIIEAMKKHEVIPDLLDEGPQKLLKVTKIFNTKNQIYK